MGRRQHGSGRPAPRLAQWPRHLAVALMTALLLVAIAPHGGHGHGGSAWTAAPLAEPAEATDPGRAATSGDAPDAADRATAFTTVGAALADSDPAALIPTPALAAYHRAAMVMERAAPRCQLTWSLLAGLGGALTDHGRLGGEHRLTSAGRTRPGIVGEPLLDARGQPQADSDRGELDADLRHDRAVGPLLVSPSGWRTVGVDADGDDRRDPQDIDDAALATAVLLCTSGRDLARPPDQRAALLAVHADPVLVDTALALARTYAAGTSTPPPLALQPWPSRPAPSAPSAPTPPTKPSGTSEIRAGSAATPSQPSRRPAAGGSDPTPGATPAVKPDEKPGDQSGDRPDDKPAAKPGEEPGDKPATTPTPSPPEQESPSDPDTCRPEAEDPTEQPTEDPTEHPMQPPIGQPTDPDDETSDDPDDDTDTDDDTDEDTDQDADDLPDACDAADHDQSDVSN